MKQVRMQIPEGQPERLSISFWIFYYLGQAPGDAYHNLEQRFIELKERGFNTIRVDSGAGLCYDVMGQPRGTLSFHAAFPGCCYLRQWPRITTDYRCDVLQSMLALFTLAGKYDVKVILSSWFYLHTFWFVERRIRDEFFSLPPEQRFQRFASELSLILKTLEERDLHKQIAFVEIFNESEVFPGKWRLSGQNASIGEEIDLMHRVRHWHEDALHFLQERHPEILFAVDTSTAESTRPEILPRNAQVWNRHSYYAWDVYAKVFEAPVFDPDFNFDAAGSHPDLGAFLRPDFISLDTIKANCGNDGEYEPGWYARSWLYHNLRHDMIPELDRRLAESFLRDLPSYRKALEDGIRRAGDLHEWLLPNSLMVMGEGPTYCPSLDFRWEETCNDYWDLINHAAELIARQGCWGFLPRTNSGPDDPVWTEYPERLYEANRRFQEATASSAVPVVKKSF